MNQFPPQLLVDSVTNWSDCTADVDLPADVADALETPAYIPPKARLHRGRCAHILFDGGSAKGIGTAGYVILDQGGSEVCRVGLKLTQDWTNNESEAEALKQALVHYDDL